MHNLLTRPGKFIIGCNYWASHAGTQMWSDWRADVVEHDLQQLSAAGQQVLRVFPLWPDFQPITLLRGGAGAPREIRMGEQPLADDETGRAGMSETALQRFGVFADLAHQRGLKLVVGLLTGWMSGRLFVPPALEGLNVLTDPLAIQWETRFVRCFVKRFKDHPAILAWDLGNEVNVMAEMPSPESAWAWVSAITDAIRAVDPSRPVVSGMHGVLETWTTPMLGELTDLLTTHPYPYWTQHCDQDPVNTIRTILHSTSETRMYADTSGRPCIAEELGTLGPGLASDEVAADFVRACLFSLWANDCHGLMWWCAYDQDLLPFAPYDWNTCERELGLFRSNREAKPVVREMSSFRAFLEGLPFRSMPERIHEAVCLLSLDQDQWGAAYSSFILAKQAGFDLEFQYGEQPLKPAELYLVPSVRGYNVITRRRWLELLQRVRAGAALYISIDDALLDNFQQTYGMKIISRQKRPSPTVEFTIPGLGSFTTASRFRTNLQPAGAEVLGQEIDGNPVFTRFSYGQGQVYLLTVPVERCLTETPGAFHDPQAQPFWQIYRQVAAGVMGGRVVRKEHPMLGVTEHPLNESERIVVAINYSPEPLTETFSLADGWALDDTWRGHIEAAAGGCRAALRPNDGAVWCVKKASL